MKCCSRLLSAVLLSWFCAAPLFAQVIPLDAAAISRLGLVFMPVTRPDSSAGVRFPAMIIASPNAVAELYALHGGVLETWHVEAGQNIVKDQVLATVRSQTLLDLQQQWGAAVAEEAQSRYALTRDQALFADGIIARQRLEESERQAVASRFALQTLGASLRQAGFTDEELETLRSGNGELGRYRIRAPAPGSVAHLAFRTGEMIEAGEVLLSLSGEGLWVSAELPARLAARVQPGATLRLSDRDATLVVRQKDRSLAAGSQTVGILAEFTSAIELLPGQIVSLQLPPQADGIVVPADAVVHNGNATTVFVRVPEGVESRLLDLQPIGTDYLAIDGLTAGEEVVVRGAALLKGITLGLGGE